ncbi:thrombospondin type 3 repeat-containing protein [Candidatus Peregrinibacteria bacterium]|nr:thrombospondin type 3 repeat-containing protein [Candidatus Peregrinibacteria bacterium]
MKIRHGFSLLTLGILFFSNALTALAASGDLVLYDANVTFSTSFFLEGADIKIKATVQNNSPNDLLGSVRFQTQSGNIGSDQPISALGGKTDDVFVIFTPEKFGYYDLTVTVIPWDPSQDNPSNNVVNKKIYVEQDTDRDGQPNSSDPDIDGDQTNNEQDAFPLDSAESLDSDGDGIGNNSDPDDDNDGYQDSSDALPLDPTYSKDMDSDGIPDEKDEDVDGDGINNSEEMENGTDVLKTDSDGDNVNDKNDAFPLDSNESVDMDADGVGDNSDPDIDGDGIQNSKDANPYDKHPVAMSSEDTYLTNVGSDLTLDASASMDPDGTITRYVWQFGKDDILEGPRVSRSFDSKGLQTAILTVTDDKGQSSSTEVKIRVLDYRFVFWAILFSLILISIAFYTIYRYNLRAVAHLKRKHKS